MRAHARDLLKSSKNNRKYWQWPTYSIEAMADIQYWSNIVDSCQDGSCLYGRRVSSFGIDQQRLLRSKDYKYWGHNKLWAISSILLRHSRNNQVYLSRSSSHQRVGSGSNSTGSQSPFAGNELPQGISLVPTKKIISSPWPSTTN